RSSPPRAGCRAGSPAGRPARCWRVPRRAALPPARSAFRRRASRRPRCAAPGAGLARAAADPLLGLAALVTLGAEQPLIALDGGGEIFHQLAADPLERLDVDANARLLDTGALHRLLAAQLGLAPDEVRLVTGGRADLVGVAAGARLHVVDEALGR